MLLLPVNGKDKENWACGDVAGFYAEMVPAGQELSRMRIDLLKRWLKMYPYGYCDGINFQTCRANENTGCPYCESGVNCSDGDAAVTYYRELLRFKRYKPRKAAKIALWFADCLPSIMRSLDRDLDKAKKGRENNVEH